MQGYLIFSLNKAIDLSLNIKKFPFKKKIIFLTDRVIIFNLLKKNNLKVILIQNFINQKKFNKIFSSNYEIFNQSLKDLDKKSIEKINYYYNTFRYLGSRDYVGIICMVSALSVIVRKFKIKEIILFSEIKAAIFNENIYKKIFEYFCNSKKIKLTLDNSKINKQIYIFDYLIKIFLRLNYTIKNSSLLKLKVLIKKYFTRVEIFKKDNSILIIEPAFDLNFMDYKIRTSYFKSFDLTKDKKIYQHNIFKSAKSIDKKKPYLNIILNYLKYNVQFNKILIENKSNEILKFIKKKKIKKIFWGATPNSYLANILDVLKSKNIEIYGTQHGGKYFIQQDDIYHKDSDYSFCDKFLAYGVSKLFNKKKFSNDNKILNTGSFKTNFLQSELKNINDYKLRDNLLYIPISSSFLIKPFYGSMEFSHYKKQTQICANLNKISSYKKYIKIISRSLIFERIIDQLSLEHNPINFDLKNYKNFHIKSDSISNVIKSLKPKIIVCDSLSTPIYELLLTSSEIILFLDKENLPKRDVISSLSKRVYIIKNLNEMKITIDKIKKGNVSKAENKEFIKKFYLKKHMDETILNYIN
jgi:hypothetical protein